MTEVGTRDRWIMAGLVTLGLFTVFAGVLSGQSTINYVLGRDAREAALAWTGEIDEGLRNSTEVTAPRGAGGDIEVLNAVALEGAVAGAGEQKVALPAGPSFRNDGFNLIDGFDRLTRGWFLSDLDENKGEFVSRMDGFAVVTLTTSLLIVMGFSVPAAIASRRIRERWHAEDKIHFLAMHDSLTGLSNRVQFHQHLERAT